MTDKQRKEVEAKGWTYIGAKLFKKIVDSTPVYRTYHEITK